MRYITLKTDTEKMLALELARQIVNQLHLVGMDSDPIGNQRRYYARIFYGDDGFVVTFAAESEDVLDIDTPTLRIDVPVKLVRLDHGPVALLVGSALGVVSGGVVAERYTIKLAPTVWGRSPAKQPEIVNDLSY